jgi:hypothetical protein
MLPTMRFLSPLMMFVFLACGCWKQAETVPEDLLMQLIAGGQWASTINTKGSTDRAADFSPYRIQFRPSPGVAVLNNGMVATTGTRSGRIATRTINANFPNPDPILIQLNGAWRATGSEPDSVKAMQP